jgi:hypothetical protein
MNQHVIVKAQDRVQVDGRLVHVDPSLAHNGGFGNLLLEGAYGPILIKGSMVEAVLKK